MQDAESERQRLGAAVKLRRTTLGLSVSTASRAAGIDRATWTSMERGERDTQEYNYGPVERVLRWAPGSIAATYAGGTPTPADDDRAVHDMDLGTLVRMVNEVLNSKFSSDSKVSMIRDLIDEAASYVAVDHNANKRAPDSSAG